ncbi:Spx/MgsR family RNA polymerase-binding regulatory protein [Enterococcus faecium]
MVIIYTGTGCTSSKNAINWFKNNKIPFIERKINQKYPLKKEEVKTFLLRSDDGFEDLLSKRSRMYKKINKEFESYSFDQAIEIIVEEPSLIKKPILLSENKIKFGFTENIGRSFITRKQRELIRKNIYHQK